MHLTTDSQNAWEKKDRLEINNSNITVGDFNASFSILDKTSKQKINEK